MKYPWIQCWAAFVSVHPLFPPLSDLLLTVPLFVHLGKNGILMKFQSWAHTVPFAVVHLSGFWAEWNPVDFAIFFVHPHTDSQLCVLYQPLLLRRGLPLFGRRAHRVCVCVKRACACLTGSISVCLCVCACVKSPFFSSCLPQSLSWDPLGNTPHFFILASQTAAPATVLCTQPGT